MQEADDFILTVITRNTKSLSLLCSIPVAQGCRRYSFSSAYCNIGLTKKCFQNDNFSRAAPFPLFLQCHTDPWRTAKPGWGLTLNRLTFSSRSFVIPTPRLGKKGLTYRKYFWFDPFLLIWAVELQKKINNTACTGIQVIIVRKINSTHFYCYYCWHRITRKIELLVHHKPFNFVQSFFKEFSSYYFCWSILRLKFVFQTDMSS